MAQKEEYNTFLFEQWLSSSGLSALKDIFIKHDMIDIKSLSPESIEFAAFVSDPSFHKFSLLLPPAMSAMKLLQHEHNNNKSDAQNVTIAISSGAFTKVNNINLNCKFPGNPNFSYKSPTYQHPKIEDEPPFKTPKPDKTQKSDNIKEEYKSKNNGNPFIVKSNLSKQELQDIPLISSSITADCYAPSKASSKYIKQYDEIKTNQKVPPKFFVNRDRKNRKIKYDQDGDEDGDDSDDSDDDDESDDDESDDDDDECKESQITNKKLFAQKKKEETKKRATKRYPKGARREKKHIPRINNDNKHKLNNYNDDNSISYSSQK